MRKLEYISPSAISKYLESKDDYYLQYLADVRGTRMPQTRPMSIGSAFDAYVKSFLHERIFGAAKDSRFQLSTLFEAQVEPQNRDWAWPNGRYAFECYQRCGALADLLLELETCIGTPRFEIEVRGAVHAHREGITKVMPGGVVLLGKPDLYYINKNGCHVILDWKVNGWLSQASPKPGYMRIRSDKPVVGHPHKDCMPMVWNGTIINCATYLENVDETWARQLAIYGWLLGVPVGEEFITAIDQLACKSGGEYPDIRVAEHRLRISSKYQWAAYAQAQELWDIVNSNHFFRNMTLEESQARCAMLEAQAADPGDIEFNKIMRGY